MNSDRPVIGVNCVVTYNPAGYPFNFILSNYLQRIWDAGGFPWVIPSFMEDDAYQNACLEQVDGLLFVGGPDYHPEFYHEPADSHTDPARILDQMDIMMVRKGKAKGLPCMGICAGCQLLAIASGGKLKQHIPDAEKIHRNTFHSATMLKNGRCSEILQVKPGEEFRVNSFHHQCVIDPGVNMEIKARAFDGTTEIIESTTPEFVLGLQFHPERMDDLGPLFFQALVNQAGQFRDTRTVGR